MPLVTVTILLNESNRYISVRVVCAVDAFLISIGGLLVFVEDWFAGAADHLVEHVGFVLEMIQYVFQ